MSQAYVVGKSFVSLFVGQVVRDVGEESTLRPELIHQAQGIGDRGVRGMGAVPERVQKQDVQVAQAIHGLGRDLAEVSQVGGGAEAKTMDGGVAMDQFDRLKCCAEQLQRTVDAVHLNAGDAAILVGCVKDVAKNALQRISCALVRVQRNLLGAA